MFMKCSTAQSFIRTEMTTYRIGTLARLMIELVISRKMIAHLVVFSRPNQTINQVMEIGIVLTCHSSFKQYLYLYLHIFAYSFYMLGSAFVPNVEADPAVMLHCPYHIFPCSLADFRTLLENLQKMHPTFLKVLQEVGGCLLKPF